MARAKDAATYARQRAVGIHILRIAQIRNTSVRIGRLGSLNVVISTVQKNIELSTRQTRNRINLGLRGPLLAMNAWRLSCVAGEGVTGVVCPLPNKLAVDPTKCTRTLEFYGRYLA